MKIIDRYILKQFIQTVFFGLFAFAMIFVVVDMMENLDDFIDQQVAGQIIVNYYLVFTPEIIRLMLPVSVLFASLFTAGKMSNVNELTAIKAGGVSLFRFMLPVVLMTFIISLGAIYFGGYVVPLANKMKIQIEMDYLKRGFTFTGSNIFFQDSKNRIVSISYYSNEQAQAIRVSIQEFEKDDLTKMTSRLDCQSMRYDSLKKEWKAINGSFRRFFPTRDSIEYFAERKVKELNFTPVDLSIKQQKPEEMNLTELKQVIQDRKNAGNDPTAVLIEYHSRYAFAFTSLVIVLFGLPLSTNKRKGGLAIQVGINILITFIYLVLMKVVQAFGKNGALDPVLTAWFVNYLFLGGAVISVFRVKQ